MLAASLTTLFHTACVLLLVSLRVWAGEQCACSRRLSWAPANATCGNTSAPLQQLHSCPSASLLEPWPRCLHQHARCHSQPSSTPPFCPAPALRFRSFILPNLPLCDAGSDNRTSAAVTAWTPAPPPPPAAADTVAVAPAPAADLPAGQPPAAAGDRPAPAPAPPPQQAIELKARRRINLAAESEGAAVLAANPGAKKPEKAIDRDADSFLRSDCAADKWLVVELAQVARVEDVEVTMKELYSCRIREFALHCSRELPAHLLAPEPPADPAAAFAAPPWQHLGNFTADNRRGSQAFAVAPSGGPSPWCKYLALLVHTHYGTEPVFALNSITAFGVTAAEDLEMALTQLPVATPQPPVVAPVATAMLPDAPASSPTSAAAPVPPPGASTPAAQTQPQAAAAAAAGGGPGPAVRCAAGTCPQPGDAAAGQPTPHAHAERAAHSDETASKQAATRAAQQQEQQAHAQVPQQQAAAAHPQPQQGGAGAGEKVAQAAPEARGAGEVEVGPLSILELQSGSGGRGGPSVYDMVKQEILGLKHNSTLAWHHVVSLERAVQRLSEAVAAAEGNAAAAVAEVERRAAATNQAARTQLAAMMREHEVAVKQLLSTCQMQLAGAKERSTTLMLLSAGQSGLLVLTGTLAYASYAYRRLMVVLAISNCVFGLYLSFKDHVDRAGGLFSL